MRALAARTGLDPAARAAIVATAAGLVEEVRERSSPTVMEAFLAEYGLSTDEGSGSCASPRRCSACRMPRPSTS